MNTRDEVSLHDMYVAIHLYVPQEITMPTSTVPVATVYQLPYKGEHNFHFGVMPQVDCLL